MLGEEPLNGDLELLRQDYRQARIRQGYSISTRIESCMIAITTQNDDDSKGISLGFLVEHYYHIVYFSMFLFYLFGIFSV